MMYTEVLPILTAERRMLAEWLLAAMRGSDLGMASRWLAAKMPTDLPATISWLAKPPAVVLAAWQLLLSNPSLVSFELGAFALCSFQVSATVHEQQRMGKAALLFSHAHPRRAAQLVQTPQTARLAPQPLAS